MANSLRVNPKPIESIDSITSIIIVIMITPELFPSICCSCLSVLTIYVSFHVFRIKVDRQRQMYTAQHSPSNRGLGLSNIVVLFGFDLEGEIRFLSFTNLHKYPARIPTYVRRDVVMPFKIPFYNYRW